MELLWISADFTKSLPLQLNKFLADSTAFHNSALAVCVGECHVCTAEVMVSLLDRYICSHHVWLQWPVPTNSTSERHSKDTAVSTIFWLPQSISVAPIWRDEQNMLWMQAYIYCIFPISREIHSLYKRNHTLGIFISLFKSITTFKIGFIGTSFAFCWRGENKDEYTTCSVHCLRWHEVWYWNITVKQQMGIGWSHKNLKPFPRCPRCFLVSCGVGMGWCREVLTGVKSRWICWYAFLPPLVSSKWADWQDYLTRSQISFTSQSGYP